MALCSSVRKSASWPRPSSGNSRRPDAPSSSYSTATTRAPWASFRVRGDSTTRISPPHDERHAVAQVIGHRHVVRRQEDGASGLLHLADEVADAPAAGRVEPHRRLVEEDELRIVEQGAGDAQPRLHSLGVLGDEALSVVRQTDHLEQRLRPAGLAAVQGPEVAEVLDAGQPQVVIGKLERDADPLVVVAPPVREVAPQHGDRAPVAARGAR